MFGKSMATQSRGHGTQAEMYKPLAAGRSRLDHQSGALPRARRLQGARARWFKSRGTAGLESGRLESGRAGRLRAGSRRVFKMGHAAPIKETQPTAPQRPIHLDEIERDVAADACQLVLCRD